MHDRVAVGAEHPRDREAVDVGVEHADRVAPLGQGDGEVGGDARLAHAALARGDQQRAGLRAGLGERDRPALGVAVGRRACRPWRAGSPWRRWRSAARSSSVITVKSRPTTSTPSSGVTAPVDPVCDLVAQRAAGHGEGDE